MKPADAPLARVAGPDGAISRAAWVGLLLYGGTCYGIMVLSFAWFAAWIANLLHVTIDSGPPQAIAPSLALDTALLVSFCLLHSLGARSRVKRVLRRVVPHSMERVTYCLVFSILLFALCRAWQPVPSIMWRLEAPAAVTAAHGLFVGAWAVHFLGIGLIGHNEFFGLRQIGFAARGETYRPPPAMTHRRYVWGHVILLAGLIAIPWATPAMSLGRLLFAVIATAYCVVGAYWSERDRG